MNDKPKPSIKYKSHAFKCGVKWTGERTWNITHRKAPEIKGGPPPEFAGADDVWSPEELILSSVNSCTLSTFVSYTSRKGFEYLSYESEIEGLLEHDGKLFRFTRMTVRPRIVVKSEEDIDVAKQYVKRAHELCFISNSVNAEVVVEPEIIVADEVS